MILQNIVFPKPGVCTEEEMYFRRKGNTTYYWAYDHIELSKKGSVSFDTYFNSFSIGKWTKYTNIGKVSLNIEIEGHFYITLKRMEKYLEDTVEEVIFEQSYLCKEKQLVNIAFDTNSKTGIFIFNITALSNNTRFYGGYYSADVEQKDINEVNICASICHYRKENYIQKNMDSINEYFTRYPNFKNNFEVIISDNSQTLPSTNYDFVKIFKNKNVGGAGGFGRCMIEALKSNANGDNITHVLIMDDDLTFDPECIYRTWAFMSCLKEQYKSYFISGAMCRSDKKSVQHENGAMWNTGDIRSLKWLDLNHFDACLFNDCYEETPDFAAWWYCAIPVKILNDNLPLPIFYREDDVEYSLRNADGIISMNGICVWHEPFENKFTPFVCYYHTRNRHITNAIHYSKYSNTKATKGIKTENGKKPFNSKKVFLDCTYKEIMRECACLRYKIADLYLDAAFDFLKGIDWLLNLDTEEYHKEIMSRCYKMKYADEIKEMPFMFGYYMDSIKKKPLKGFKKFIWDHSDNGHLLNATKDVWVPMAIGMVRPEMFVRAKRAYHYDQCSHKGFITKRSSKENNRIKKRYRKLVRLTRKHYNKVAKEYALRYNELISTEFWKNYLGL